MITLIRMSVSYFYCGFIVFSSLINFFEFREVFDDRFYYVYFIDRKWRFGERKSFV